MSRPIEKAAGIFCCSAPDSGADIFRVSIIVSFLILVGGVTSFAQTTINLTGYVYDNIDGHAISAASVEIIDRDYRTLTDRSGYFYFQNIPEGDYILEISAEGYRTLKISNLTILPDVPTPITARLTRKIYDLPDKLVVAAAELPDFSEFEVIDNQTIRQLHVGTVAEVLENIEGLYVQRSGLNGASARVSIRGCDPEHVLILLDGHRLNAASEGTADLNSIPLEIVEKIEIYRGGQSARFGPDALGGVVNIISQASIEGEKPELHTSKYWGDWKTDHYELSVRDYVPFNGIITKFAYSHDGSAGDFDYNYQVMPRPDIVRNYSGIRQNSFSEQRSYFWSAWRNYKGVWSVSTAGQLFRSKNGLPGSVSEPDTTASKTDDRFLASAHLLYSGIKNSCVELGVGYSRFTQYFNNLGHPLAHYRYETQYINDIFDARVNATGGLWSGNEIKAGIDYQRNILYHDDFYRPISTMGRTVRGNVGIYFHDNQSIKLDGLPLINIASVDFSARWDNTGTSKDSTSWQDVAGSSVIDHFSYKAGFTLTRKGDLKILFRGSYGTSYRLPSINSLFWKGDTRSRGNPGLRPEKSEHSDIGIEVKVKWWADFSGGITYFHNFIRDLIEWQPGYQGVWQPVNLAAARITGHEDFLRIILFDGGLRFEYQNTISVAKNRNPGINSFNKYLTYRPHYVTRLNASARIWKFWGQYSARFVDIRYNKVANTKWYDAYRIDDASLGIEAGIRRIGIEGSYQVRNLWDETYVLIGHYPMPGRQWRVEVSASMKLK